MSQELRDKAIAFFEARACDGKARVRAALLWVQVQESLRWPTVDGSDNTAETINNFTKRLSDIIGEDNAVEFRLRFL
ncbi:hypothetical protein [Sphingomonas sp. LK11]|jgi:hypothetical protein|uniref:hypothetical protein n=1 Tax=Sphingomonas sp. LK11 TaxID=1390395 RepID=UPI0012ECA2AC|nr:hypothetical protein [Sphingomonas sp. LK11]